MDLMHQQEGQEQEVMAKNLIYQGLQSHEVAEAEALLMELVQDLLGPEDQAAEVVEEDQEQNLLRHKMDKLELGAAEVELLLPQEQEVMVL